MIPRDGEKCLGKLGYRTRAVATSAVSNYKIANRPGSPLNVYYCNLCGMWHIGRESREKTNVKPSPKELRMEEDYAEED